MGPDELLAQIRDLLDQYLALGGDTPVAAEAQALASAIDGSGGSQEAPPAGAGAPPSAGVPPTGGGGPAPEEALLAAMGGQGGMGGAGGAAPPSPMNQEAVPYGNQAPDFATASAGAEEMLKRRKAKA